MRIVKTNKIHCFLFLLLIFSCKQDSINLSKKNSVKKKTIKNELVFDFNEDNKKDVFKLQITNKTNKPPYNFYLEIKYSFEGLYKTKKIVFKNNPHAIFWGVKVVFNSIRIGYSDEFLNEFVYYISYNRADDIFYLQKIITLNSRDLIKYKYDKILDNEENFAGRTGFVELEALKICKIINKSIIIKNYFDCDYQIVKKECIKIPKDYLGRAEEDAKIILGINLEKIE